METFNSCEELKAHIGFKPPLINLLIFHVSFDGLFRYLPYKIPKILSHDLKKQFLMDIASQTSTRKYSEFVSALLHSKQYKILQLLPTIVEHVERDYIRWNLKLDISFLLSLHEYGLITITNYLSLTDKNMLH